MSAAAVIAILKNFFTDSGVQDAALILYGQIVEQARVPEFYHSLGVPDSPTGRFDMLALHGFLVLHRLRHDEESGPLAQALSDTMFADMDRNLREMGVGDLSVGKHMKKLASHYFGRVVAYEVGLEGTDEQLGDALRRNLYATVEAAPTQVNAMIGYVRTAAASLQGQPFSAFNGGIIEFAPFSGTS